MTYKIKHYIAFVSLLATSAYAKDYTNKTFVLPQSHLYNMAMPLTTWHTQINKEKTTKWAGSIEATGFYQRSENKGDMGKYFGIYATHEDLIRDYMWVSNNAEFINLDALGSEYIVHKSDAGQKLDGQVKFNPYQESYGLRFDYNQKLGSFFFKAALPVVYARNNMDVKTQGTQTPFKDETTDPRYGKYLLDYLAGNLSNETEADYGLQEPLKKAKIVSSKSKTGVADIDLSLGYNFLHKKGHHAGIYLITSIPCGNKPRGEFLFEPVLGNAKQWSFGLGWDSKFRLWKSGHDSIELLFNLEGRWLYKNTQKRTIALKDDYGKPVNFGQYILAGKEGDENTALRPLANILTRDVKIDYGLMGQGLLGLAFNAKNFTFDIGYNCYAKKGEKPKGVTWAEDTYAIADPAFDTEGVFLVSVNAADPAESGIDIWDAISSSNLDLNSVKTPHQLTHKIYGGIGYAFNEWKYPLMLGLGSSYEFNNTNSSLEQWALWGKLGFSF